jgi:hypothetical protein
MQFLQVMMGGEGGQGRGKLLSVILSIHAGFTTLHNLSN